MPKKVFNNVVDHRLLDNGSVVEDVTSVALPSIEHPTTSIKSTGMVGDVDMPNTARVNAMELTINHNKGVNHHLLTSPGKHNIELRLARQVYDTPRGEITPESVKYRFVCVHKKTDKGNVENDNPMATVDTFSVLRFEEIVNGSTTVLIDVMAGILKFNGKDYASEIQKLLE